MPSSRPPLGTLCLVMPRFLAAPLSDPPDLAQVLARNPEVTSLEGRKLSLGQVLKAGKPGVVAFWATGCPPCRRTLGSLAALHRRFARQGLQVVGLTVETPAKARESLEKVGMELEIPIPVACASPELYSFMTGHPQEGVPRILVFDAQGQGVHFAEKPYFWTHGRVKSAVARAMKALAPGA